MNTSNSTNTVIYKILTSDQWAQLQADQSTTGAPIDVADGFVHFSTLDQVQETADKHFKDQTNLYILALNSKDLGDALKWEPSRGGALFPHLYATLDIANVVWAKSLPCVDGRHELPALL